MSSAANGIQHGDQRSVSERARVTLRADIPAGTGRLPDRIRACLFDMDGTLTETATLHAAAWKQTFDDFLAAARELGVEPAAAAVFEDALVGVAAGRAGGFACVVGVDRAGQAVALHRLGADVVADLAELLTSS